MLFPNKQSHVPVLIYLVETSPDLFNPVAGFPTTVSISVATIYLTTNQSSELRPI